MDRKSKKNGFYSYKAHLVEGADSELIIRTKTTPSNWPDGAVFQELIDGQLREARHWGLIKVSIQSFRVALRVNLKRLVKLTLSVVII